MNDESNLPAAPSPIAIIGMGCLFPRAAGLPAFWGMLRAGRDGITEVPGTHWSPDDYFNPDPKSPDMTYCRRGGFLEPAAFDPSEFGIPPTAIEATDTSQLLALMVAKAALDDAGYGDGREFDRERVSVILGVTGTQELVIPLGARLGHPIWRKALLEAGLTPEAAEHIVQRIGEGYVPWQENSFPGLLGNVVAGRIANRLDLRGTNCVVDAACASSLSAIHLAMMELQTGRADLALSGGVDALNDIFMHMCFSKTPALSPTGDARPFDQDADGTVLGEGVGMVVLKQLADAERDADRIYAVIRGVGTSSDGRSQSIYAPHAPGQQRCLRRAYEAAGVDPATVELIEAHGTGTKVGDATEFEALAAVFRESRPEGRWCAVGSVKSQIGHTKSAAGAAGLIKAALALHHKVLPPTIKVSRVNPKMGIEQSPFYVNAEARPWLPAGDHARRAGVSSFGFGGSNFHLVLEEYAPQTAPVTHGPEGTSALRHKGTEGKKGHGDEEAEGKKAGEHGPPARAGEPAWDGTVQIIALSAATREQLAASLVEWRSRAAAGLTWAELAHRAHQSRSSFRSEDAHRLVLIAERGDPPAGSMDDPRALRPDACSPAVLHLIESAADALRRDDRDEWSIPGVYYGGGIATGKLALLFPGQGSQYVGMGRDWVCTFPEALDALSEAAATDRRPVDRGGADDAPKRLADLVFPPAAFSDEGRAAQHAALTQTDAAQPAIGAISAAMLRVLKRFGVAADAAAGHSFGELVALHCADRIDSATLADLARRRGRAMAAAAARAEGDAGAMLAVEAPLKDVLELIRAERWDIVLANRNAPTQGVLSGARDAIQKAEDACRARGWRTRRLDVAAAFHSPLMRRAATEFERALKAVEFGPAVMPVYANETGEPYPEDGADARRMLGRQLLSPVHFVSQIENLYEHGVRTFIEVGPRSVLTGLARSVLGDRPHRAAAMDASAGRRPGLVDLARMLGLLAAAGHAVQLSRWERTPRAHRPARMVVPLVGANQRWPLKEPRRAPSPPQVAPSHAERHAATTPPQSESQSGNGPASPVPVVSALTPLPALGGRGSVPTRSHVEPVMNQDTHRSSQPMPAASPVQHVSVSTPLSGGNGHPSASDPARAAVLGDALRLVQDGLRAMQALQQQTAAVHQQFLQGQVQAHQTFQTVMESQQRLLERVLGLNGAAAMLPPYPTHAAPAIHAPVAPSAVGHTAASVQVVAAHAAHAPVVSAVQPASAAAAASFAVDFAPTAAPPTPIPRPTVAAPVAAESSVAAGAALTASSVDGESKLAGVLLQVVSELTGYPIEMLELDMDMEADLGIDSIKRVEILAALQERYPAAQAVNPEYMGGLRTLRQIVQYSAGAGGLASAPASVGRPASSAAPADTAPAASRPAAYGAHAATTAQRLDIPESAPPADASPADVTVLLQRGELTAVELPPAGRAPLVIAEGREIWVTEDGGGLAAAIVAGLKTHGLAARLINLVDPPSASHDAGPAGLIIVAPPSATGANDAADSSADDPASDEFLKRAFRLTRSCAGAIRTAAGGRLLATITRMDGACGLYGDGFDPVRGGLAGLIKTTAIEWPGVRCRALDVGGDFDSPAAAAAAIVAELGAAGPAEVGLLRGRRIGLRVVESPAEPGSLELSRGDVVLMTGGARGVTAEVAIALARAAQPTLALLGRSPAPAAEPAWLAPLTDEADIKRAVLAELSRGAAARPTPAQVGSAFRAHLANREILRTLRRIEDVGGRAVYFRADVRDAAAIRSVIQQLRRDLGPVRGLVHAAGTLHDRLIVDKTDDQFADVLDTKVAGLRHVLAALDAGELRQLVLFSSVSGRFGNRGQADYAMANEALNKIAQRFARRHPSCRTVSINWGPWEGGMVTPALQREFERAGVSLIPLDAGAQACVLEMACSSRRAVEVVIGSKLPAPAEAESARGLHAGSKESLQPDLPSAGGAGDAAEGGCGTSPGGTAEGGPGESKNVRPRMNARPQRWSIAFERELTVDRYPVLESHVIGGRPVLPLALICEWLAHAGLHGHPGMALVGLDDMRVLRGVALKDGSCIVRAAAGTADRVEHGIELPVELRGGPRGEGEILHARGTVLLADRPPAATEAPRTDDLAADTYPRGIADAYDAVLFHGERLRCIERIDGHSPRGMVARLGSAPPPSTWMHDPLRSAWLTEPLVLDGGLQMGILWAHAHLGAPALPSRIAAYRQFARSAPRDGVAAALRVQSTAAHRLTADLAFVDAAGSIAAEARGVEWTVDASLAEAFQGRSLPTASV